MTASRPEVLLAPLPDTVRAFLAADPLYGVYALGYLDPAWRGMTRHLLAVSAEGHGVALLVNHAERPQPAWLLFGERRGLLAILSHPTVAAWRAQAREHHQEIWLTGQPDALEAAVGLFYPLERRSLHRYAAGATAFRRAGGAALAPGGAPPVRLAPGDAPLLNRLYGLPADDPFAAEELARHVYYGTLHRGDDGATECVAAAGTHVVARPEALVAIGNIYTSPGRRGQGHATACVEALCAHYAAEGYQHVLLNVDKTNETAIRLYTRLGFRLHSTYQEHRAAAL